MLDAAIEAEQTALQDMKETKPTTRDGALALLDRYLERLAARQPAALGRRGVAHGSVACGVASSIP